MVVFESWIRMFINENLWNIFTYSSIISGAIN